MKFSPLGLKLAFVTCHMTNAAWETIFVPPDASFASRLAIMVRKFKDPY